MNAVDAPDVRTSGGELELAVAGQGATVEPLDETEIVEALAHDILGQLTGKFLRSIDSSVFRSFVQTHQRVLDERKEGLLMMKRKAAQLGSVPLMLPDP